MPFEHPYLPQTPEDHEGSILGPCRPGVGDRPWIDDIGTGRILARVAEYKLARPQQILTGLALIAIVGVLPESQDVAGLVGNPPAHAWL